LAERLADRYLIERVVGAGGMATVYLARDLRHDRHVAINEELVHGQPDVYLVAADGSGARHQVSVDGGEQPRWTKGGREIVFRRGSAVMAVSVAPERGNVGQPVELFRKGQPDRLGGGRTLAYDVAADGSRFLLVVPDQNAGAQSTVVVLNWLDELESRLRASEDRSNRRD
jgi:hypothetical protein